MSQSETSSRRMGLWLLLGSAAPLIHYSGGGYMTAFLASAAILPLNLLFRDGFSRLGKAVSFLEWLWITLVLAAMLPAAATYWPGEKSKVVVPLVLLVLAAVSGEKQQTSRGVSTLFWLGFPLLAAILFLGTGSIRAEFLKPVCGVWPAELTAALLLPTVMGILQPIRRRKTVQVLGLGGLCIWAAVVFQGVLGAIPAMTVDSPYFELGKSMGKGNYEMIASVAATLGWYGFCTLLHQSGVQLGMRWGLRNRVAGILTAAAAGAWILLGLYPEGRILTAGCVLLWVLVPVLSSKNKNEKR